MGSVFLAGRIALGFSTCKNFLIFFFGKQANFVFGNMASGLSVLRGEKLPVSRGAGLTAKGRARYNREHGSHLRAPAPHPRTKRDAARRKSFCARSRKWTKRGSRGAAARKRWNC